MGTHEVNPSRPITPEELAYPVYTDTKQRLADLRREVASNPHDNPRLRSWPIECVISVVQEHKHRRWTDDLQRKERGDMRESISAACRAYTLASYPEIARAMGGWSHSSWCEGARRFGERPEAEQKKFLREIGDRLMEIPT
jgi:hypothetical protein